LTRLSFDQLPYRSLDSLSDVSDYYTMSHGTVTPPEGKPVETTEGATSNRGSRRMVAPAAKARHYGFSLVDANRASSNITFTVGKKGKLSDDEVLDLHRQLIDQTPGMTQESPAIKLAFLDAVQYLLIVNSASVGNMDNFGGIDSPKMTIRVGQRRDVSGIGDDDHVVEPDAADDRVLEYDSKEVFKIIGSRGHAYMRAVVLHLLELTDRALRALKDYGADHHLGAIGAQITSNALEMGIPGFERWAFVNSITAPGIAPSVYTALKQSRVMVLSNAADPRHDFASAARSPPPSSDIARGTRY